VGTSFEKGGVSIAVRAIHRERSGAACRARKDLSCWKVLVGAGLFTRRAATDVYATVADSRSPGEELFEQRFRCDARVSADGRRSRGSPPFAGSKCGPFQRSFPHESISLAFITALELLPPKQRPALLLVDVLGWRPRETAELLKTNEVSNWVAKFT
jgi:hypothetical protein